MSDFAVQVRLKTLAGVTMFDLHDEANGYEVRPPLSMADEVWRRVVSESLYVDGGFESSAVLDAGRVVVRLRVSGATWSQVEARRLAARAAWIDTPDFLLDVTLEGVTVSYRASRPDVSSVDVATVNLLRKVRTYELSFPVQPSPTVSGV